MRNTIILAALILARCGAVAVGAPAPLPLVVNSQSPTAPGLSVYRGSETTVRVSFYDGTNATALGSQVPYLAWATNSTSASMITSSWSAVSGRTGTVDCVWTPADLNYAAGRYYFEAGIKSASGNPQTVRHGVLTIIGSPYGAGASATTWGTNWNLGTVTLTGVVPEGNLPMSAILTNVTAGSGITQSAADARYTQRQGDYTGTVAGVSASIVATSATGALARVAAVESAGYLTAEAQDLGDVLALGNDAQGSAVTNVGTIRGGGAGTASGAELALEKTADGGDAELRSADNGTSGVFLRAADGTVYRFYDQRADFGGATVSNVVIRGSVGVDGGASTVASSGNTRALRVTDSAVAVVANSVTNDVLTSNSVASTLADTAAPVSGAAVLALTNDMFRPSVLTNSVATIGIGRMAALGMNDYGTNMAIGYQALYGASTRASHGFGYGAGKGLMDSFDGLNHAYGYDALLDAHGALLHGYGSDTLQSATNCQYSHAYGKKALNVASNDYLGHAFGYGAGLASSGMTNTYIGRNAGAYATQKDFLFMDHCGPLIALLSPTNNSIVIDGSGSKLYLGRPSGETHVRGVAYYNGFEIATIEDISSPTNALLLAGGTMAGSIAMGGNNVTGAALVEATTHQAGDTDYTERGVEWGNGASIATNASGINVTAEQLSLNGTNIFTRPTTMAGTPWTDYVEANTTGAWVYARAATTVITWDQELYDAGNILGGSSWTYSGTGMVQGATSANVNGIVAGDIPQLRIFCNATLVMPSPRDTVGTAGNVTRQAGWLQYNDAATNIWRAYFSLNSGPSTNAPAAGYSTLRTYRLKNAGE